MNSLAIATANLLCIAFLLYFFDFTYRSCRVDLLRRVLFHARDGLFEAAAKGFLPFDHPAYGMTRQMLNGMIRFAHELSLWRTVVMYLSRKAWDPARESEAFWHRYAEAVKTLPERGQAQVREAMARAHVACLSHVLHTSLVTFPFALIGKWVLRLTWRLQQTRALSESTVPRQVRRALDREAYLAGSVDVSA
jgi:hypothetical protein